MTVTLDTTKTGKESIAAGRVLKRFGNVGTRIFGGRMGTFDNSTVKTFMVAGALAQKFDAIRLIFANASTTDTVAVNLCKVSSPASAADLNNSAGTFASVTFAGAATGTVPVAVGASRRGFLVSDWIALSSTDRSDGGTFPLFHARAYITTAATISVMGNGTDSFTNWATRTNGRIWCMRYQNADQVTTPSGFTDTTNRSQSPIVGVQYLARGRVVTVMGAGDSITEGRGTYLGEGFGVPACEALSDMSGIAYEWANIGSAGVGMSQTRDQVLDVLAAGIYPDIFVLPNSSPNEQSTPITAANIGAARQKLARALADMRANQVEPILWTWVPTNPAVLDWGSSDSLRTAYNADTLLLRSRGQSVADFSAALSGTTDGDGQVNMLAGTTTDNIHPNDTGNAVLTSLLMTEIKRVVRGG